MKKRKIRKGRVFVAILVLLILIANIALFTYNFSLRKVDNKSTVVEIDVPSGMSANGVLDLLKENNLIRNELSSKIYIKLNKLSMQAGKYELNTSMSTKEILKSISSGKVTTKYNINITFKEGISIRDFAKVIEDNTNNKYDDVMKLISDTEFLDELINKYWFITDDIKNNKLYYPLEGYLFPDTYTFTDKDVSIKTIVYKMLDQMNIVLSKYKDDIGSESIHRILTLASVIEKEGKTDDFKKISSVFTNRTKYNMAWQSCATALYGVKKDFSTVGIADGESIDNVNDYNTYQVSGYPVGPIGFSGEAAIDAAIHPDETELLYFLSDNKGVTYFFKTYAEHQAKQVELQNSGKWDR